MKFTEALWDEDHAQLMFKTDIIAPVTGQPYVMSMSGVGNWDEANRVFAEVRSLIDPQPHGLEWEIPGAHTRSLELERLPSRYGLLKSNAPTVGGAGFSPMETRETFDRERDRLNWEPPCDEPRGCEPHMVNDYDPADSFDPED